MSDSTGTDRTTADAVMHYDNPTEEARRLGADRLARDLDAIARADLVEATAMNEIALNTHVITSPRDVYDRTQRAAARRAAGRNRS